MRRTDEIVDTRKMIADMSLKTFLNEVQQVGLKLTPEELLEVFWLAAQFGAPSSAVTAEDPQSPDTSTHTEVLEPKTHASLNPPISLSPAEHTVAASLPRTDIAPVVAS